MIKSPMEGFAREWARLSDDERQTESGYVSGLLMTMDVWPHISGGQTRFELTDDQLVALVRRVRKDGHAHDPIECACELSPDDAPQAG